MWRVLVPLDGTVIAECVIPDAERLAGPGGTVILVIDEASCTGVMGDVTLRRTASAEYLERVARSIEAEGFDTETHVFDIGDPASVIDRAAAELNADIMAVATHARTAEERWRRGSVAWTALMRSVVPVLLRRAPIQGGGHREGGGLLVPLDGSDLAEGALPLAQALAVGWSVPIWLLQAVEGTGDSDVTRAAEAYLIKIAEGLTGSVHHVVISGAAVDAIALTAARLGVTDIVMTSHGKTGLSRAIVGSVADEVIHRVECPVIVLPPLLTLGEVAHDELAFEQEKAHERTGTPTP